MTFNRMGTVPLPLALHLASYTVLGLFCLFAGALNLIDPVKIPHGLMFLAVCGFSWGYVFGILMARREVVILGFLASAAWLVAAAVGNARSRVVHRQSDPSLAGLGAELDDRRLAAPHHMLGVGHEIDDDLLQLLAQAQHGGRGLIERRAKLDALRAQHPLTNLGHVMN